MSSDHRELGRELELFATTPTVGAGLPLWLPDGAIIRAELEKLAAEEAARSGCTGVYTPVLAKRSLFERSGHWDKFSTDMFPEMRIGGESFVLRPANCPHHTQVYASRGRSYRDLPIRLSELGSMFRSELSGVLGGLNRVRQISLDDAHVFCTPDQVQEEVRRALGAVERVYATLGIAEHQFRLSKRKPGNQYLGDVHQWVDAERQLRSALDEIGVDYVEAEGEAAFYGPKIDVQVTDARGREETVSTVQLDFNQPDRFGLHYIGEDGQSHRPVMIHRGVLGSMERMVALLIERYDGRMPPWLAPRQVAVLPVSEVHRGFADEVYERLLDVGVRTAVISGGSLGSRIRAVRTHRDPYIAVVGDAEVRDGTVSVTVPMQNLRSSHVEVNRFVSSVVANAAARSVLPELFH